MARLSTRTTAAGVARSLAAVLVRIMGLSFRVFVAGVMRIPLKYRIPVVIVFAGVVILVAFSQGRGGSSAMHAACSGFRQWQSNHDPATLTSATNNLDRWVSAQDYGRGSSQSHGWGSSQTQWNARNLDIDIGQLDLIVQYGLPGSLPTDTRNVVNDCKGA